MAEDADRIRDWIGHVEGTGEGNAPAADATVEAPADEADSVEATAEAEEFEIPEASEDLPQYKKAMAAFNEGDMDGTLRGCVKVLNADAAHYKSRVLLGRAYLRQKQFEKAIEQLEGALVTCPEYPEGLYFLGQAFEKSGQDEKARESYQRYVEVAPTGARADQLREILKKSGQNEKKSDSQIQCELCLRFFKEEEVKLHEGKHACEGCLALLSDAPEASAEGDEVDAAEKEAVSTVTEEDLAPPKRKPRGMMLAGAALGFVLLVAVFFTIAPGFFVETRPDDDPETGKNIDEKTKGKPGNPKKPKPKFDKNKVVWAAVPANVLKVLPYRPWAYKPTLSGLEHAPKNMKTVFSLGDAPKDMKIDAKTGALTWTPRPESFDPLLNGFRMKTVINAVGSVPGKKKKVKELFKVSQEVLLHYQFGFVPGEDIGLQYEVGERMRLLASDFTGDRHPEMILAGGRFEKGTLKIFNGKPNSPFSNPRPLSVRGQVAAVESVDLNEDKKMDLVVANQYAGNIDVYLNGEDGLARTARWQAGRGPVAFSIQKQAGQKRYEIAVLLGMGKGVALNWIDQEGKFWKEASKAPLQVGGPTGWIFPWTMAEKGQGYLVITPLGEKAIWFVPLQDGKLGLPQAAGATLSGVIVGACVLKNDKAKGMRLVMLVNMNDESVLYTWGEVNGELGPLENEPAVRMKDLAMALASADLNLDGQGDLVIALQEGVQVLLRDPSGPKRWVMGPAFDGLGKLSNVLCVADVNGDTRPDLMVVTEKQSVNQFLSRVSELTNIVESKSTASGGWPNPDVLKKIKLGAYKKHPKKKFQLEIPGGFSERFEGSKTWDALAYPTKNKNGKAARLEVQVLAGAADAMDEAALKKLEKAYPGLEWVHKPSKGTLNGAQAVRAEALAPEKGGPKRHLVWYVVMWKNRHARILINVSEKEWGMVKDVLEGCAHSLKSSL